MIEFSIAQWHEWSLHLVPGDFDVPDHGNAKRSRVIVFNWMKILHLECAAGLRFKMLTTFSVKILPPRTAALWIRFQNMTHYDFSGAGQYLNLSHPNIIGRRSSRVNGVMDGTSPMTRSYVTARRSYEASRRVDFNTAKNSSKVGVARLADLVWRIVEDHDQTASGDNWCEPWCRGILFG